MTEVDGRPEVVDTSATCSLRLEKHQTCGSSDVIEDTRTIVLQGPAHTTGTWSQ